MSGKGRYSKVYRRMWVDEKVKKLSQPTPCGFTLWLRLLTGPELTNVPGLFPAWEAGLANALKWPLEAFREAFREVSQQGMVEADWDAGLVWVPNALEHNEPESTNVVISWGATIDELPDCELKRKAFAYFEAWAKAKGKPWAEAWAKACPKGYSPPSPIQEQEQETRSDPGDGGSKDLTGYVQPAPPPPPPMRIPIAKPQRGQGSVSGTKPVQVDPQSPKPPQSVTQEPPSSRRSRAIGDLMSCPIGELAKRCRENPYDAAQSPVCDRPELIRVNAAWAEAVGLTVRRLGTYGERNRPLTALLEAFEVATEEELLRACEAAGRDEWCTGRKGTERDQARKRDIGCLSQAVLRRLLDASDESRPKNLNPAVAAMLAEERKRKIGGVK